MNRCGLGVEAELHNEGMRSGQNRVAAWWRRFRDLRASRQTVNSIETGRYLPSLPLALAIGRFFGKPVEEVFHDDSNLG